MKTLQYIHLAITNTDPLSPVQICTVSACLCLIVHSNAAKRDTEQYFHTFSADVQSPLISHMTECRQNNIK